MILPIGDSPNPRFTPWINYLLIAANVGVFLLFLPKMGTQAELFDPALREYLDAIVRERGASMDQLQQLATTITQYDLVVFKHGFRPIAPNLPDAFAAMFLHGGWSHLLGNMLFLWIYGDNVEHHLGRFRYLLFYLVCGVLAAYGDGVIRSGASIPSVGASGAISGVLGAYFLWFPRNKVRLFVMLFPIFFRTVEVGARWVLGAYVVFNNLMPLLLSGGSGGVSYGAHLGGFAAGLGAAWLWQIALHSPEPDVRALGAVRERDDDPVSAFSEALRGGWFERAAGLYLRLPRSVGEERIGGDEKLDLAAGLESRGLNRAALNVLERVIAEHRYDYTGSEARTSAARLMMKAGLPVEAFQLLKQATAMPMEASVRDDAERLMVEIKSNLQVVPPGGWW